MILGLKLGIVSKHTRETVIKEGNKATFGRR